uniref:ALMS1 centrosome and basal body associated protein n=1 Tax=Sus scrofa TaxID=9823 RepID=A0A4X1W6V6_PIG
MEPEDLPWPGELEEEEEAEEAENLDEDEVVMVEEMEEEEGRDLDADLNYESQRRESTDDEDDEEAKAWLQAHPSGALPLPPLPRYRYSEGELTSPKVIPLTCHVWQQPSYQDNNETQVSDMIVVSLEEKAQWASGDDQRTESWHCLPQEMDSSHTLDTTQTRFNVREKGTEVTNFPSLEEGILTKSENQVKEPSRDLLCSPLLVIQDSFASPDLPLLTCLTKDQEFGPDSLFHQSELDFARLRGIPGKSEDTEWFSRPSEVSEALFQAASEVASDLVSFSVSQHPLTGSEAVESQRSLLTPEQRTKEETVASDTLDELKTHKNSDSYDALCSYMSWKTQEVIQEPGTNLADVSAASDTSDEYITPKGSDSFDASCSYAQFWKQEALQQSEKYLTRKDHDSYSDSSDLIDKNKIPKASDSFSAPFSYMPWSKQEASHHPEIGLISKDHVSFLHEVTPPFNNKMSHSFLHCFLERGGRGVPLTPDSHSKSVYLRAPTESEVKQQMDSLEGYERDEDDLGKGVSQCFELKENRNTLMFSGMHPSSSEIQYIENVFPDNSAKVSEGHTLCRGHDSSMIEASVGPLQTSKSNSDETAEQLYFQEEKDQKATSAFGGKNVDVTENIAFQAVIASIEPSKKESTVNEIQTDISKSSTNDSQKSEQKNPDLFLLNYDENSFFDKLNHSCYQSTPGVFESVASKPSLYKKDNGDSSLYWHPDLKSLPSAPQEIFIKPVSLIPELKSSSLSEKSVRQAVDLGKTQSALFQDDTDSELFLPIGKIKSVSALDLAEKLGSSNIIYPMKVWTSDSLVLQELKPQTFEEVADSSNYILGKNVNSSNIIEGPSAAVGGSFSANLVACDAKSQGSLPVISDAKAAVGQETLLKANIGPGEIPWPMGAKSSFTIHTVMQNDSYFVEGLQGKAESDICTLDDAAECCSLDENAVVCSKRVAELQREICGQGDLTSECTELAGLKNLLDDLEICDSSPHWQSSVELPSKEESSCEVPVGPSDTDINQSFSSALPPFVPHESTRELEYHSADLRMLRVSPDTVPGTLKHLTGDTSKGGVLEIPQSTFKSGITTTPEDSDTGSHLSLSSEDFPELALRSPQVKNIGQYTDTLNQQTLTDKHLTEETLKISTIPGLVDQKTGIPPSSYLLGEKHSIFYPQALPGGHLPEEALKASILPVPTDQKTGIPTVPAGSYSPEEKTGIFYQQGLPSSHLPEEALKVSVLPGPADQKTGLPTVSSTSYLHGEKPHIFYQQTLPESHLTEQAVKVSAAPGPSEQKTGIPTIPSTSYAHRQKPSVLYQQELPDSHLTEQAQKISALPGLAEQKSGISAVPSASYPHREKPSILYQQELLNSHLIQQVQQVSAVPLPPEQKTGFPAIPSTSYSHGEEPSVLYQQELPDSHLIQQIQQVSAAPGLAEQKTGIPRVPSSSYSPREKSSILYQQELPDSHLIQQVHQVSAAPGSPEQKTGIPTIPSTSYSHREKPHNFYQQELPDSHPTEQAQKVSAAPGLAEQKTEISTVPSSSYSYREKPSILYQQELPGSHLTEQAQKVSAAPGLAEQKTGISIVPSASYPYREKPSILYQQELPDSHLTEQTQQVSAAPGLTEQKTEILTLPSTSYSHQKTARTSYSHIEKPSIFYQQDLPNSHLTKAHKVPADPELAHQKSGIPIAPPAFYSQRGKTSLFHQQELPDSHLSDQTQKISAISGSVDQNTGIQTVPSSSYSHREKPIIFYQQELPDSHLTEEALKVSAVPRTVDLNTGIPTRSSRSYSFGEKPGSIFYQQVLPDGHLTEEALKVSSASRPSDQKTGILSVPASFYSYRERPSIFSPQALPGSHPSEEALKDSASPGLADQKTRTLESSSSDLHREKSSIFYQQELPDSHLAGETLKVSGVSGPGDQKTGIPIVSSASYLHKEKPIILYPQALPDRHLIEEALNVSTDPGPADQKTGIPVVTSPSYSHKEKPIIFYQQALSDSQLTVEALKVSGAPRSAAQKTGIPIVPSSSYSYRERPIISYQQELPDLTQVALKILEVPGPADQNIGITAVPSPPYSHGEKPIISYQKELPEPNEDSLTHMGVPGQADQTTGIQTVPPASYSRRESPLFSYQKELPDVTEETLKVSAVPGLVDQKIGLQTIPPGPHSYGEKANVFYQQELPDLTEEALKIFALPGPADQNNEIPTGPSGSYSHKEKLKILPDDQKTELPLAPPSSYSHREKPKTSTVIGPDDQKTPLLTGVPNSYSQRVKSSIFYEQQLPDRHQSGDILKISPIAEPTDVNSQLPIPLSSSYSHREKSNIFYPEELPDKHLTGDALKVSTIPGPADQKTVLPAIPSSSFSYREKPVVFYQQDLPERRLTEENLKFSSSLGQADQITGLSTVPSGTYLHSEKHKLVSDHVQRLIDKLDSPNSSVISNNMPLNSRADGGVVVSQTESLGFEDVGSEEVRGTENSSRTLKEIQTLLMEAENIALRRCNFPVPVPLVPFRDVSDISFIKSKKMVCFKEPPTTDESNGDLSQRQPFAEESPSNKCIQKDISTQTNLQCQRGTENWEFITSTTVRNPLQEAESKARVALDETLRQCKAANSVMRSEPEAYSGSFGNKIVIPMMTIIKSDSSSDASSCSWDSNSLESVSDVLLNFFPCSTPKTSMTDSRDEEGLLESDDGGGSSVDSLAAHVKNLLQCESSLNHAKQILRNAEEEESRVRARAWNLKFNMAHECGYSISELNEDDRRKVEEIKAKLFGHGRTTDLSKGLQSPRGIGCHPEAVCSHIIIESHEKGCFRTLTAERPQLDSRPYVFRSADSSEMIRGQRSPSSWRNRHINFSKSLDQSASHFRVWNSLQLQSPSPFQNFIADDLKISKGLRMPFREKLDPWLSELEPACVPPEEMDCHSSSQMLPPEPMKKFTTSITFSSHRHSKCFSDSSFLKVGVTEGSQCTGASLGVFNSHFTKEQNLPRDLKQENSFPSSFKTISQSPDKAMTLLAENSRQGQKLSVEHSHQEEKLIERSDFKGSHSKPGTSANDSNFKEVHFADNHTLISMGRPSSTLGIKEKNVTITPDLPSHIFLEQELSEQSKAPHADHHVRKHHSPPPQHQDYVAPNLPCRIFLEERELFKQSKAPHVDHQMRENHSPLPPSQDFIAPDLPSSIFLEQRQLLEQSKTPDVDHHMRKHHSPLPQGQDYVVERNNQHKPELHISDMINVEAKFSDVVSPSAPVVTSASTPPSNRKALSCIRITLCPKTPSKVDSGTLDKRIHSLDPASKTRMNSEFNSDLQTVSPRSLEPTSKLLTSKPIAQDQASLGFLGPKSSPDLQVVQSPLPDSNITQDLKIIPFQNSQIVTSRQTQVNISDLEEYFNPEGTPVSADRSPEEIKTLFSPFSGKLSSDAVTQITTESPGKAVFSSEIFVSAKDREHEIPELTTQKVGKGLVKFASSSSVQQITVPQSTDVQPLLLPYKPSGSTKMYYVPQLSQIPSSLDSKSDTTIESSHSGSNDAIAPDFPAQVLGTRDDDLTDAVNIKHKEGIYSKRAVTKASLFVGKKPFQKDNADAQVQVFITGNEDPSGENQKKESSSKRAVPEAAQSEEKEPLLKDTADSSTAAASGYSTQPQDSKIDNIPATKAIKQKEEMHSKKTVPKEAWPEEKKSLQIDIAESRCHSEFENTTHSVFRSAKFYFHHPVHLPNDQDFCHESLGRSVFMRHSWKDFFQHHPDKEREQTFLPPPYQNMEKTKTDYTRIESLSINVNLENKEVKQTPKSQARAYPKCDKQVNDPKSDHKPTPELTTQPTVSLNELWNKYQERQKQQKPPEFGAKEELSLVERLDRLAKLLQHPITHSLQPSESTQDDSRGEQEVQEWSRRQQQQKNKLQKKKRYKSLEKCHKNTSDLKKNKILSTHQPGRSNQIKIEQIKFDKYILRKQPGVHYINNTSSDSRHSEESELLTDTPILSTTTSPVESDILAQTDKEVTLHDGSSSISTIDTARLIHAFGHERVCLSPRRIKLYSSITDHQRRYLEKQSKKNKKALNTGYPQITSEHTRRKHIQVTDCISSDSVSSSTSSFWSSSSTLCSMQNVHMLNKGIQAGTLEIVNGVRKHTRDVGMTFPTPSSSEARVEEDSDVTSLSEEKIEEKRILTSYFGDTKLRKNKQSCCEGVSWFVPVENVKSGPKKENLPKFHGPGISWFAPITNTKPWREPLREQNWQEQHIFSHGSLAGPGRHPLKPFVRATLQESLQLHRPDFISRSGERIKRLKLIVQERKLQNVLQSEREALFNTVQEWQGCRNPMHQLPKRETQSSVTYQSPKDQGPLHGFFPQSQTSVE